MCATASCDRILVILQGLFVHLLICGDLDLLLAVAAALAAVAAVAVVAAVVAVVAALAVAAVAVAVAVALPSCSGV